MKTSPKGIACVKHWESLHDGNLSKIGLQPKLCPAGLVTIGWGHVLYHDGEPLTDLNDVNKYFPQYETIDEETAEKLLAEDLKTFERGIDTLKLNLKQHEFDALVSFSYNVGYGGFLGSTLLKRIKGLVSTPSIEECFKMWNKCKGKELQGLTLRRKCEAHLYLTGELKYCNI